MISIITPHLNMLDYLKKCHASIMDQGVNAEHIVVDGGSTDGSINWLKENTNITSIIGKDNGMYDAINKGIKKSTQNIVGYLNSDEQYLPGTLKIVLDYFKNHPEVDILFGDKININSDGSFNSFKKSFRMDKYYVLSSNLYIPSCSLFFRKEIFNQGYYFNDSYKSCGDAEFLVRLKANNFSFAHIKQYIGAFTIRESNLSQSLSSKEERKLFVKKYSNLSKLFLYLVLIIKYLEKLIVGAFYQKFPLEYSIYTDSLSKRKKFIVKKGSHKTQW